MDAWYIDENGRKRRWTAADEAAYQRDLASRKPLSSVVNTKPTPGAQANPPAPKRRTMVIGVRG